MSNTTSKPDTGDTVVKVDGVKVAETKHVDLAATKETKPRSKPVAKRTATARKSREAKQMEDYQQIAKRAAELVGNYAAQFSAEDAAAMKLIVGRQDPVRFAFDGEPGPADGRDGREVLAAYAAGTLERGDKAASQIRAMTQRVRLDERAPGGKYPSLWGRKPAALLLALAG